MGAGKKKLKQLQAIMDNYFGTNLPCAACASGDHVMCYSPTDTQCCCADIKSDPTPEENKRGGPTKAPEDITDVQSTGRKRAAQLYPIEPNMLCEWTQLAKAGGGVEPIIGCMGNLATDRHHGPDKNTLNNKPENVHRICSPCHNWWHAKNDPYYGERPAGTEPFIPLGDHQWCAHDPVTKADIKEVLEAGLGRKAVKKNG